MLFFSDVSGIRPKARLPNLSFPNGNLCNQKQNPQNFLLELLLSHLMKLKPWAAQPSLYFLHIIYCCLLIRKC